jgi:hypothetical protein
MSVDSTDLRHLSALELAKPIPPWLTSFRCVHELAKQHA